MNVKDYQYNALKSVAYSGIEKAEKVLQHWLVSQISIDDIHTEVLWNSSSIDFLFLEKQKEYTVVELDFSGSITGRGYVFMTLSDAKELVAYISKQEYTTVDIDENFITTIMETGVILLRGGIGAVTNGLKTKTYLSSPRFWTEKGKKAKAILSKDVTSAVLVISWKYRMTNKSLSGIIYFPFNEKTMNSIVRMVNTLS